MGSKGVNYSELWNISPDHMNEAYVEEASMRASSPVWASEASHTRTCERAAKRRDISQGTEFEFTSVKRSLSGRLCISQPVLKPALPGLPSLTGLLSRAFLVQRSRPVRKSTALSCCEGLSTSYFFPRRRPRSRQAKFKMEDFLKHSKVLWCCVLFCFVSIFLNRIHKLCFELFLQVNNYLQVSK